MRERTLTVRVPAFTLRLGAHGPRSALPDHAHDDPTLCYVLGGGFTEYSGGEATSCGPGTLKLMPAGETHWNRFGERRTVGLRIDVDRSRFVDARPVHALLDERHHERGGAAGELARRLVAELLVGDEAGKVAAEGLGLELLAALARARAPRRSRKDPRWLDQADALIRARYVERLSVEQVARAVDVHPATLSRAYRIHRGCTVGERIRRLRLERAARALVETSAPLSAIALDAGFYDQSHFTNVFRRSFGITPGAYRSTLGAART